MIIDDGFGGQRPLCRPVDVAVDWRDLGTYEDVLVRRLIRKECATIMNRTYLLLIPVPRKIEMTGGVFAMPDPLTVCTGDRHSGVIGR